jgi:hypothetical protein
MDASRARNDGLVKSSLLSQASRNDGSCGKGHSGCMYVKKSSMRAFTVGSGQMVSADSCCGCDDCDDCSWARAWAAFVGDWGGGCAACGSVWLRRRFLMSSAWRLGGPRRRLGRSKVHGISSEMQARHGGPVSSHWHVSRASGRAGSRARRTYLDFADAARVAGLAQAVGLLLLRLGQWRQRVVAGPALVVQRVVRVQCVGLQHVVEVLDLGEGRLLRIGPTRRPLAVVELGIGIRVGRVYGRVMRVIRRGWVGVVGGHCARCVACVNGVLCRR